MASEYDDPRDQDPRDNQDPRDENESGETRDSRVVARAKQRIKTPAIVLLVIGIISGLSALSNVPALFTLDAQLNQIEEQWDQDPNMKDDQRKEMKRVLGDVKQPLQTGLPIWIGVSLLASGVTVLGAVRIMNLKSRGLGVLAALSVMLPLGCCCIPLPVGVWVLIVMSKAEVKAGFEAVARGASEY